MGLRLRKSIKLGKLARINLSKSGISLSGGVKGARVSINNKGQVRKSVGIPGTGIYYTEQHKIKGKEQTDDEASYVNNIVDAKPKSKWLPIWLSNWLGISFILMILGFIGTATQGILIIFLPISFISLLGSLVMYIKYYVKYKRSLRDN